MKIFITGVTGFAGSHLTTLLLGMEDVEITGVGLKGDSDRFTAMFSDRCPGVRFCDLADEGLLEEILSEQGPDAIIHLAARAQVAGAWQDAPRILETNVIGTELLMHAAREAVPEARILLVSSSEVYGKVAPGDMPITEKSPLKPNNPYSVSKVATEFVGLSYHEAFGAHVVVARPFNHVGPGQVGNYVVPSFARQIAEIEAGKCEPVIRVGNLESRRDFTDVRDVVKAYFLLATRGRPGEVYNIASGRSHAISEILEMLIGLSEAEPRIENVPELMRPSDTPVVEGDASKLRELGDWAAEIPLKQSLADALDFWREQLRGN